MVCGYFLLFLKIGKNRCLMLGKWLPPVWEMIVHLAVAGDVFDGVLFFPRDVLDKIWD